MESATLLPELDQKVLHEKANEFAMKGATESIKEFYSGYNSPYRKAIEEKLQSTGLNGFRIDLPDIIAVINDSLSKEIDNLANEAIAKSFIPMVKRFLTREEPEIKFSYFLEQFIKCTDAKDYDDCNIDVEKSERHGWLDITISHKEAVYDLTLHVDHKTEKEGKIKYIILSLPRGEAEHNDKMKISIDGATIEIPFTRDILKDEFMSFVARLVIAGTTITMDCNSFDEDMFEKECHC